MHLGAGLQEATSGRAREGFAQGLALSWGRVGVEGEPLPRVMGEGVPAEWAELSLS